jgi:hypothetical protein
MERISGISTKPAPALGLVERAAAAFLLEGGELLPACCAS